MSSRITSMPWASSSRAALKMRRMPLRGRSRARAEVGIWLIAGAGSTADMLHPPYNSGMAQPLWTPSSEQVAGANMTRFIEFVRDLYQLAEEGGQAEAEIADYPALYRWSIEQPQRF